MMLTKYGYRIITTNSSGNAAPDKFERFGFNSQAIAEQKMQIALKLSARLRTKKVDSEVFQYEVDDERYQ